MCASAGTLKFTNQPGGQGWTLLAYLTDLNNVCTPIYWTTGESPSLVEIGMLHYHGTEVLGNINKCEISRITLLQQIMEPHAAIPGKIVIGF